ncbi:uncharacterized protein LOC105435946 [Cucumis sativus]|uniref:DUF7722 domain-containing protein n=1 Tax=Cucumis sativus TaxID=3659 RepID=A0A0A0KMW8_CUCSA|nr:uncharacterized protein LOC105435946 [Cucumis sativus]KGN49041.1 hypothetical protein Csa_003579 [Cucumis sativus]
MDLRGLLHSVSYLLGNPNEAHAYGEERSSKGKKGYEELCNSGFQMPLHYPRYKKSDYQKMEEWKLDLLLKEYGLSFEGSLEEKRAFAMGAFLWPDQN